MVEREREKDRKGEEKREEEEGEEGRRGTEQRTVQGARRQALKMTTTAGIMKRCYVHVVAEIVSEVE